MDLSDMMAADAQEERLKLPTDDKLQLISDLANQQLLLEQEVLEKEKALSDAKDRLRTMSEVALPGALESVGMLEFKLTDGSKITIREDVFAGITEENKPAAFKWLADTGNDGLIKNEFKSNFGKGQDDEAKEFAELLSERGYSFTNNKSVHPQTLKAFVKKRMAGGNPVPEDIFSVHIKRSSMIVKGEK